MRAIPLGLAAASVACAAVVGLDAYSVGGAGDGPDGSSDSGSPTDAATSPDAAKDAAPALPSFCAGISFYVSFDKDLMSAQGDKPSQKSDGIGLVTGRLGQGISLAGANTIYYPVGDAGPPRWTDQAGSIAAWVRPNWKFDSGTHTFARQAQAINSATLAGPRLIHTNNNGPARVGLTADNVATYLEQPAALWRENDWNHMVGTWMGQRFTITMNGAADDAGADAGHAENLGAWSRLEDPIFFRLGSEATPVDSVLDDVAFWTRALTLEESRAIYAGAMAGRSIGDLCKL